MRIRNEESLFELIKSMTPSEKRYFKLFVNANDEEKSIRYVNLFDKIVQQKKHDERSLIRQLNYQNNPNGFAVAKNYLYQLLLRSLCNYNRKNKSVEMEISELLIYTEILFRKGLFKSCFKILQKAAKLARKIELFDQLITVLKWMDKVIYHLVGIGDQYKLQQEIVHEVEGALAAIKNEATYYNHLSKARAERDYGYYYRKKGEAGIAKLREDPLLQDIINAKTVRSKFAYYSFYNMYLESMKLHKKAYENNVALLKYLESLPAIRRNYPEILFEAISNYLRSLLLLNKQELFDQEKHQIIDFPIPSYSSRFKLTKEIGVLNLLSWHYNTIEKYELVVGEIRTRFEKYLSKRRRYGRDKKEAWTAGMICWAYIRMEHHEEALEWLMKMEEHIDRNVYEDQYIIFRVFALIIHFELGNYRLLDSIVNSLQRYMGTRGRNNPVEASMLRFSKKIALVGSDAKERLQAMRSFQKEIQNIGSENMRKSNVNPYEILRWINAKLAIEEAKQKGL